MLIDGTDATGLGDKDLTALRREKIGIISSSKADPGASTGLDGGLKALREQQYGVYMLTAVGAGLICYGLFLMVKTKFARM